MFCRAAPSTAKGLEKSQVWLKATEASSYVGREPAPGPLSVVAAEGCPACKLEEKLSTKGQLLLRGAIACHSWATPCPTALSFPLDEKLELGININPTQKQLSQKCLFPGQSARIWEWMECLCRALVLLHLATAYRGDSNQKTLQPNTTQGQKRVKTGSLLASACVQAQDLREPAVAFYMFCHPLTICLLTII